ncbi:nitroreductase family deazaflavin-dependent oxidoreductase [Oerskovia flava]|uniref:nitroreductase family deazaflavin-dependent oxidoreductase n=1 Tax=Oerskovia flava TaxID=2986422 RepID=UPI00223F6A48|nr:nitroreductase family deazaflavin-dependent oxidoreductase [Oerskovia sp. JB1-3-2]
MTTIEHSRRRDGRRPGTPGRFSRWMQQRANSRLVAKIRRGRGTFMGMDVLILHTVGRRSGAPRLTPLAWFDDGAGDRLVVASGGGALHPDWYLNLMAASDGAAIELPGAEPVPVGAQLLSGDAREQAWRRVVAAQPRIARYQAKSDREYPLVRLVSG